MDAFSDFDAQFEQTLALVNGPTEDQRDPNQFRPSVGDKRSEYLATLRFIPPAQGPMFVKKVVHFIKVGNRTVRLICPKTHDDKAQCDVCSDNIQSHRSKIPALVERARAHGNKTRWVANVLVLEDSAFADNAGRVMWWEFPNQIMEYIEKLKNPPNPRIPSINAFHPIKGADFFLCMKQVDGFTKYDGSQFLTAGGTTPIGDEAYISQVRSLCHDIQSQIIIPSQEEIADIMAKAGTVPIAGVQKTYANVNAGFSGGNGPSTPSVGGFAPAQVAPPDEFEQAFAQAGQTAPTAGLAARPSIQAPVAVQQPPKAPLAVPVRPAVQTPESLLPQAQNRVTPIPQAPATVQPHTNAKPVDDENWFK